LKNNGEQTTEKTLEEFPKDKIEQKEAKNDKEEMVKASTQEQFKPYTKDMYWIVLSRFVFNNKLNKTIVIADTMKQAVEDFLACKNNAEEFLMISKIEPDALSVIASTL